LCKYRKLTVAVDKLHWSFEAQQKFECFPWHWARYDIALDDDLIYARAPHLFEHSLKRRKIPMNVIECSHSHYGPFSHAGTTICPPNARA
jgi:hypothetical protein